ncbi:MAG TPA: tRNA lysidine(34) synthetase TilS, partial [Polyangiaceae bacterium]|nr:tRNA lysidine(34) synthetase TilS [Polyangiaceae bacterium]
MARSHPPTLITLVRGLLRDEPLIARGTTVLAAVSGGPDSMALLHVLAGLRRERGFGLFAHGVDHGLRAEAAAELDLAEAFARTLDVPFSRTKVDVARGGNLQARARDARWGALERAAGAAGATRIATGHHADDRAETMLMRILRGTGVDGLAVLPARDG